MDTTTGDGAGKAERQRLDDARTKGIPWKKWGPYLSERQWGTVREDYSQTGDDWNYFTHDQARSRTYHWGEDGIGGVSDEKQTLCFALALWNGADPILKERLFGLTNTEGNHGEDCKEYYFYLDNTPTHSYMKYLYKYPQGAYPYSDLVTTNRERGRDQPEYELLDTGVFDQDRYFDVLLEYAKAAPEDLLIRITAINRGDQDAVLDVLPTIWFRNTWSWTEGEPRPVLRLCNASSTVIEASHHQIGEFHLHAADSPQVLFTENETNRQRVFGQPNSSSYTKDGVDAYVIQGTVDVVNPTQSGTKAAVRYRAVIPAHGEAVFRLRLARPMFKNGEDVLGPTFDAVFTQRIKEADEFFDGVIPHSLTADQKLVMRQALAGMLWSKQYYYFDLDLWLREHGYDPLTPLRNFPARNMQWFHMLMIMSSPCRTNGNILGMPPGIWHFMPWRWQSLIRTSRKINWI